MLSRYLGYSLCLRRRATLPSTNMFMYETNMLALYKPIATTGPHLAQ
jgi:hypothetical protein